MTSWLAYKVVSKVEELYSNGYSYFSYGTERHSLEYRSAHKIKPAIENTGILCFDTLENALEFQARLPKTSKTTIFEVMAFNELTLPPRRFVDPEEFKEEDLKELWERNRPLPSTSMKLYAS